MYLPQSIMEAKHVARCLKKNLLNLNTKNSHLLLFITYLYSFISAFHFVSKKYLLFYSNYTVRLASQSCILIFRNIMKPTSTISSSLFHKVPLLKNIIIEKKTRIYSYENNSSSKLRAQKIKN